MSYASIFHPSLFAGRVALITGGGSGIGRCVAHELAHLGATVVLASRDLEKCERVVAEIREDGGLADALACNVRKEDEVQALVTQAMARHGRIDLLVNNAGGQFASPLSAISSRGWSAVLETNLTGIFLLCREVYQQHMAAHGGAVVNVVADMWNGMPMMAHSGAARAGVVNLTRTAALEWAASHVRVNAVAPGIVLSSGMKNYPEPIQEALKLLPREIPAGRFGTESEVAAAIVFLLSPGAAYITGETIRVDGASSLYRRTFPIPEHPAMPAFAGFHRPADLPPGLAGDEED